MNRATYPVLSVVLGMLFAASPLEAGASIKLVNSGVEPAASGTAKVLAISVIRNRPDPYWPNGSTLVYASFAVTCKDLAPNTVYEIMGGTMGMLLPRTFQTNAMGELNAQVFFQALYPARGPRTATFPIIVSQANGGPVVLSGSYTARL